MSDRKEKPAAGKAAPAGDKDAKESADKGSDSGVVEAPPASLKGVAPAVKSKIERRVFWACVWSLVALGLIVWSQVDQKPIPVIVAMSVGQVIGTLALLLFVGSVVLDLRARYKIEKRTKDAPPAD